MSFGDALTNKLSTQFPMGMISAREGISIGYDMQDSTSAILTIYLTKITDGKVI